MLFVANLKGFYRAEIYYFNEKSQGEKNYTGYLGYSISTRQKMFIVSDTSVNTSIG